jgi:Two component regulator propeller
MKKIALVLTIVSIAYNLKAQNIFPYKLNNCITESFCLDCGDEKGNVNPDEFAKLIETLNKTNNYSGLSGKIMFQVLVDSLGNGCILSHTDNANHKITQNIVSHFNEFKGWIPAKENGRPVGRTSFNLSIEIKNGVLSSKIERVDQKVFMKSFDRASDPEIFNKEYVYKNENLRNYSIKVWNSNNSNLPNNFDDHITIDKNNVVWLTIDDGLVKFNGKSFVNAEQNITKKGEYFGYSAVATDNGNLKWVHGGRDIYSYNDEKWTVYDPKLIGDAGAYKIINNEKTGEVFFCTDHGLTIYKDGKWTNLNKDKIKELPSNRIYFAKRDSKNRIWIGTFNGSVLIDENGKATSFNDTQSVLKGKCITSMDEDENGNIYFGLYEYDRKDKKSINNDEGIAIYYSNGEMKQFTTANSGMPFNNVEKVLYDKNEKVLWIATDRAGLVRYDLKGGWENYHNKNSQIPTSYISDMAFDKNGALYLATRQGLVKIEKK